MMNSDELKRLKEHVKEHTATIRQAIGERLPFGRHASRAGVVRIVMWGRDVARPIAQPILCGCLCRS